MFMRRYTSFHNRFWALLASIERKLNQIKLWPVRESDLVVIYGRMPAVWNLITEEKLNSAVCDQLEFYDAKSFISQNRAVEEKS